jgi:hypothetical protein
MMPPPNISRNTQVASLNLVLTMETPKMQKCTCTHLAKDLHKIETPWMKGREKALNHEVVTRLTRKDEAHLRNLR